ncbi:MAG: hypothetical protein R3C44_10495 [Chloroflexota bacterium]
MTIKESTSNEIQPRRVSGRAWITLIAAVFLLLWPLALVVVSIQVPTDGWSSSPVTESAARSGPFQLDFPMADANPSLQIGDVITAINGRELVEDQLPALPSPWEAGQTVRYTVQRDGETIDIPVTLVPTTLSTYLAYMFHPPWAFVIASLVWLAVAGFVFYKRPNDHAAQYLLIAAAYLFGVVSNNFVKATIALYAQPPLVVSLEALYETGPIWAFAVSLILFMLVFPVPLWPLSRFPRGVPILFYGLTIGAEVFVMPRYPDLALTAGAQTTVAALAFVGTFIAVVVTVIWSLYYNIRRSHDPIARAQYRWLALGLVVGLIPYFLWPVVPLPWIPDHAQLLYEATTLLTIVFPIALAVGILRYRLFDIDVIIRRTTSYAILTGLLLLVYFGSIVILQRLLSPITGESTVAVVLSTLLIAALFFPLRRRVQEVIDRRFFRQKYDAEQVMAEFAATVRDETDLDALTAELMRVIQETMQPEFVSVWLKEPDKQ